MTTLLEIVLINSLTVVPLAVLAFALGRWAKRPALTHVAWVLVLMKLVTPPFFQLPVAIELPQLPVASQVAPVFEQPLLSVETITEPSDLVPIVIPARTEVSAEQPATHITVAVEPTRTAVGTSESQTISNAANAATWRMWPTDWIGRLLVVWAAGSASWLSLQIFRAIRFERRIARDSATSSEWQGQTRSLATELGLCHCPQVLILDAAVSPMLWGCGSRTKLLFPAELAERLTEDARATLLAHELAHFARGDHWVRLLEFLATALFWWHPVVWLARRQIEEAEEECCDAWVVGQFPHRPRQYAEAILDTIDFLCEARPALPPMASGLGHAPFLRRRLTQIMQGVIPHRLSPRARVLTALLAAACLPLQPFVFGSPRNNAVSDELLAGGLDLKTTPPMVTVVSVSAAENSLSIPTVNPAVPKPPVVSRMTPSQSKNRSARGERIWSTAASSDGRFVVRATTARRVILTDLASDRETDLSTHRLNSVAFTLDPGRFVAGHQDGRITLWDATKGELIRELATHATGIRSIAVSPQGDTIAAGGVDGTLLIADLQTGTLRTTPLHYGQSVNCVRFSPDSDQLAVAVGDWMSTGRGQVVLLNVVSGRTITTLACATSPGALTFASNEELIVGHWDGRTSLWNLVNRQIVGSALADKDVVSAAAFSPDNPVLREAHFIAEEPSVEESSTERVLRQLLVLPVGPAS